MREHAAIVCVMCTGSLVIALPMNAQPVRIDPRAEIAAALYAASTTQAAAERAADAKLREERARIEAIAKRAKEGEARAVEELAAAQERFVIDLASKDRAYGQEIAVFRQAVEDIASSSEGAAALSHFNSGDEVGALAVLDQLVDARERARQVRSDIETAVERRQVATLSWEALDRGKLTTADVLARYEVVVGLDPGFDWDWLNIASLQSSLGNLPQARIAAARGMQMASNDKVRAQATQLLGNILFSQGDIDGALDSYRDSLALRRELASADPTSTALAIGLLTIGQMLLFEKGDPVGATPYYEEAFEISKRLASDNPTSVSLQQNLAGSFGALGDLSLQQNDREGAQALYQESFEIFDRLARADPASFRLQRELSANLSKLGQMFLAEGDLESARLRFQEGIDIAERLVAADPASAFKRLELAVELDKVGDILLAQRDGVGARIYFEESLAIKQQLGAADPTHIRLQSSMCNSLDRLGDALRVNGDLAEARSRYQESLIIRQGLAIADPDSAELQNDIVRSMWKLLHVPEGGITWLEFASDLEEMQRRGVLAPINVRLLETARTKVVEER